MQKIIEELKKKILSLDQQQVSPELINLIDKIENVNRVKEKNEIFHWSL